MFAVLLMKQNPSEIKTKINQLNSMSHFKRSLFESDMNPTECVENVGYTHSLLRQKYRYLCKKTGK